MEDQSRDVGGMVIGGVEAGHHGSSTPLFLSNDLQQHLLLAHGPAAATTFATAYPMPPASSTSQHGGGGHWSMPALASPHQSSHHQHYDEHQQQRQHHPHPMPILSSPVGPGPGQRIHAQGYHHGRHSPPPPPQSHLGYDGHSSMAHAAAASSSDPPLPAKRKYAKITNDVHQRMIMMYQADVPAPTIAHQLQLNIKSVYTFLSRYKQTGQIDKKAKGGNQRKNSLTKEETNFILAQSTAQSTVTLAQIRAKMVEAGLGRRSLQAISKVLKLNSRETTQQQSAAEKKRKRTEREQQSASGSSGGGGGGRPDAGLAMDAKRPRTQEATLMHQQCTMLDHMVDRELHQMQGNIKPEPMTDEDDCRSECEEDEEAKLDDGGHRILEQLLVQPSMPHHSTAFHVPMPNMLFRSESHDSQPLGDDPFLAVSSSPQHGHGLSLLTHDLPHEHEHSHSHGHAHSHAPPLHAHLHSHPLPPHDSPPLSSHDHHHDMRASSLHPTADHLRPTSP